MPATLISWISAYRWPLGIVAILCTSIGANGVLLYEATRPDASRPMANYYQRSLEWDQESAVRESSRDLGWTLVFTIPEGPEYIPTAPRPLDLMVTDRSGAPLTGLRGTAAAMRPSDNRLDNQAEFAELPQAPGTYRCLLTFPVDGLWLVDTTLHKEALTYLESRRLTIRSGDGP